MFATDLLAAYLQAKPRIGKVVDFDASHEKLYMFDFTSANAELSETLVADTDAFGKWIDKKLADNQCLYGIGGYMEHRTIYSRSAHFDTGNEPRRLHLGVDIWGAAGTFVYSPMPGNVHSFADNNNFGDYGPTIILQHKLEGLPLYSLYGHLSRESLVNLQHGQAVDANQQIGTFGNVTENGSWPPHLHFQLMLDVGDAQGDYPGVGQYSQKAQYLENIPDANLILAFSGFNAAAV